MFFFYLLLFRKSALFPLENIIWDGVFSRVVYCISFYRLECIIQYTLTWLKYVTEYQIVHYASLVLRWCAGSGLFFSLPAVIILCLWNTPMFYTRHVLFIYKHPDLIQSLQQSILQTGIQTTQNWTCSKDTYCCLCDRGGTRTPHMIKSWWLPNRSAKGYSGLPSSVTTPFPFSPNKN